MGVDIAELWWLASLTKTRFSGRDLGGLSVCCRPPVAELEEGGGGRS